MSEQIYKHISIYTSIAVNAIVVAVAYLLIAQLKGTLKADTATIFASPKVFGLVTAGIVAIAVADLFIALSITNKSATLAGLIEISYPLFIALFAYLFFRESQLNAGIALGGLLIFCGVAVVYWFSR